MSNEPLPPKPITVPGVGSIWQHFKGDYYQIIATSRHTENPDQWLVTYAPLWSGDPTGEGWTRALLRTDENQWPGFLDLRGDDGEHPHRFRHISGPRSWKEGAAARVPTAALSILKVEAMRLAIEPLTGQATALDANPNYRRLLRVIGTACETMFETQPEPDEPPEESGYRELVDLLDDVSAAASNMHLQFEKQMTPSDARTRGRLIERARLVCDNALRS